MQDDKNNLPDDIKNFIESREALSQADKAKSMEEEKELDREFVALRKKYKENDSILNALSQYGCLLSDCSATREGSGVLFYQDVDIVQAIYTSLMDRNTFVSYPFFKDIFIRNPNILAKNENFSLDLSPSSSYPKYEKMDIVWSKDKAQIDFILYDEFFSKSICSYTASFIRFKQEKEGVRASYGYTHIPYTQIREVDDFIIKSCECIHIGGEEPYDEQRANKLMEMAQGCEEISKTRLYLNEKYKDDTAILELLQKEWQNYKEAFGEY